MTADSVVLAPSGPPGRDGESARVGRGEDWPLQRLVDRFELRVIDDPGALVLDVGGETLSRAESWIAAGLAASEIREAVGCQRQVVAVHLPDGRTWLVMFLAVLRAGHIPVILPTTATVEDVRHVFETVKPAMVISMIQDSEASPAPADLQAAARAAGVAFALADATSLEVHGWNPGDSELVDPGTGG